MFGLFGGKKQRSAAIIDISSSSVAGALVAFPDNEVPVVPFSIRVPIEFPSDERGALAMLRSLDTIIAELSEKGLPALSRATGIHHPDRAFVAIDAPWQETSIETYAEHPGKPFVFTREMLAKAVTRKESLPEGKRELQREVVATLLNGYHVPDPFGKRAERAEIIVLSSIADEDAMVLAGKAAKRLHPSEGVLLAPFQSVAYEVLRTQYPFEKEFLLLQVTEESTSIMFVDRGIVVDAVSFPLGLSGLAKGGEPLRALPVNGGAPEAAPASTADTSAENAWVVGVSDAFRKCAERRALPRMLFIVANETAANLLKRLFDTPEIHRLWLSDEPLRVIPVISRLLSSLIKHQGDGAPDATLDLITLFASIRLSAKK